MRLLSVFTLIACIAFFAVGCGKVSRPYIMEMDRVDQKIDVGNRGYLMGTPPPPEDRGDLKRPYIAVDIDLIATAKGEDTDEQEPAAVMSERPAVSAPQKEAAVTVQQKAAAKEENIK